MTLAIFLIGLAQMADTATFLVLADSLGIAAELNPLARWLYGYGPEWAVLVKTVVILYGLLVASLLNGRARLLFVAFVVLVGLVGAASNLFALSAYLAPW